MYADLTTQNRAWLKRFSHHARFEKALDLLDPKPGESILDFGTGDGYMLKRLILREPECQVIGYEPTQYRLKEFAAAEGERKIQLLGDISGLTERFDKVVCLEVLEHLTVANQRQALREMLRLLKPTGSLIISVPIEVGLSSLLKNITRLILGQGHGNTNFKTFIFSALGIHFDRGDAAYIPSHMGFYYHDLDSLFSEFDLRIVEKNFSPFPLLRGLLNSQVFFSLGRGS